MRYLNKIVFINSAHVPYAEIRLDGNVHFIGTQGVGKSTLLRAILFFYNADKSKLGIRTQDKQKGYDEFYLPHSNSYIIYEVCRETGTFFVMTFLSRGRAAFRIVDCPYDRRFFIVDDGMARDEWGRINESIGPKVFKSNIIRGYEEFRNIIYGNMQELSKDLRRFCLLESSRYQNVPRTIQNIFLNQSLESRVIKDTIIDSMDFANDSIDLNLYRDHVKMFRQQYDDIWKWYKHEKNGEVKVRKDADRVISKYVLYEDLSREIKELCGQMAFAEERDEKRLPILNGYQQQQQAELDRQKRLLGEETGKYNTERDKLNQKSGELNAFIKKVKEKLHYYESIGIKLIVERTGKEGELKIRQESLKRQEALLTDRNQEVKQKYDTIIREIESEYSNFDIQAKQKIIVIEQRLNDEIGKNRDEANKHKDSIRERYEEQQTDVNNRTETYRNDKNELKLREQKILTMNPFRNQMNELETKADTLRLRQNELTSDVAVKQKEIDRITHETELRRKDLEQECDKEIEQTENTIKNITAEISGLNDMLSRQKGSLIEWLGENVNGWEQNIGKVLDEENVLYNAHLDPQQSNTTDTVFGLKLDVENIDRDIRTPKEIEAQVSNLNIKIESLRKQNTARRIKLEKDIAEMQRKPSSQLKTLRAEKMKSDSELRSIPVSLEKTRRMLSGFNEKLEAWRNAERQNLMSEMVKVEKTLETLVTQAASLKVRKEKELADVIKTQKRQEQALGDTARHEKQEIYDSIKMKLRDTERQKAEIRARMDSELKGLGVDVRQLAEVRKKIREVEDELSYISNHKEVYFGWLNDKKEYFNNEQNCKDELKLVRQKINDLQQHFDERRRKLESAIHSLSESIEQLREEQSRLCGAIEKAANFRSSTSYPHEYKDAVSIETAMPLADILEKLKDNMMSRQQRMEDFKKAVDTFKGNFSSQNTFNFRTELNGTEDYIEFAVSLNDFISNKKIEMYRTRTSEQYAGIIQRIAHEVGELGRHGADIRTTINEINRDFRDNNFVGVIKEIELRAVESNDRLMQQLLNIKKFDDENSFNIGQLNLFSNEDTLDRTNSSAVKLLMTLVDLMEVESKRERITLSDTFKLEFKVKENDNDTSWVEKLSNVGSDGTDILVKAMVNIMLINVFKRKASRKFGNFTLHCMMDEIGKLHPNNVQGILDFANKRNIRLINSSPTTYNASAYRYTYSLSKDKDSNTVVKTLLTVR